MRGDRVRVAPVRSSGQIDRPSLGFGLIDQLDDVSIEGKRGIINCADTGEISLQWGPPASQCVKSQPMMRRTILDGCKETFVEKIGLNERPVELNDQRFS